MGYQVAMQEEKLRKGPWLEEEDEWLNAIVGLLGERRWDSLAKASGLRRSGKSCRLRWMNYLRPNLKHGPISIEEEEIIVQLHERWGNKWSKIARRLPGRTDNEIKNYWRNHLRKKVQVQEQGNFGGVMNNDKQDLMFPQRDTIAPRTGNGDCTSDKDDILGTSSDFSNEHVVSNLGFASSPYEIRLLDWMSCCSHELSEMKHQGDFCSLGSCFCHAAWISDDSDTSTSIWNSSGSLWDMD
ncbi:hypothetical protein F0562_016910 [Nyssa sinensis]|uniref:Uncharacterized protein n=1 Tax=Nyssa sinensis TaxID=561372 RepID=A0A5J4ZFG8_9ASTE|nr:hypothetical protein F0562_016910 [Nyssa sinensis]